MQKDKLQRTLRFWDSIAISVGIVIGVGIFRTPAQIAQFLHSPLLILAAWIAGALMSLLGVFCYAELSSRYPETGGTYVYLKEAYGKFAGFLYGWSEFSINRSATIAAVAYIFATYLEKLIPFGVQNQKWVALGTIVLFTWLNGAGIQTGVKVQNFLSVFKALAILAVGFAIFGFVKPEEAHSILEFGSFDSKELSNFFPALIPILWSYGGWHESTFMSGEFKDTRRELPIALVTSALLIAGIYVFINAAYLRAVSPEEMEHAPAVAAYALEKVFGQGAAVFITIVILISSSGALNSNILTGARVPFAVGQDLARLNWIGKVHPRLGTPMRALTVNSVLASILVLWGSFEQILFLNAFEIWLFFALTGARVFIFPKKEKKAAGYSMMGYPWVPVAFTLCAACLCITTVCQAPKEALLGSLIIAAGVPLYLYAKGGRPLLH